MERKYFEDIKVGEIYQSPPYTVSRDEIVRFAREFDPQPFHLDDTAASASVFGGLTASGAHTVALQIKLIHTRQQQEARESAVLAVLGWDEVRFSTPVRPDDTLHLRTECIDARVSESKPDRGIVRTRLTLLNQKKEIVLTSIHTILVARRRD